MLSSFGASHVVKEYNNEGVVKCIIFKSNNASFKLPCNSEGVRTLFMQNRDLYKGISPNNFQEQSVKVAWRMIKDWLHSQLSLVATQQAKLEEVMLPYMWDGKRTLFEAYDQGILKIENKGDINGKSD